jgi:hypothetical protein
MSKGEDPSAEPISHYESAAQGRALKRQDPSCNNKGSCLMSAHDIQRCSEVNPFGHMNREAVPT